MQVLNARNVHDALPRALDMIMSCEQRESRNGTVLQASGPVATVYSHPEERVMLHPWRDANPFFHFYESLWMLAGRCDVAPLKRYVNRMESFSDNGHAFNAAYGYRWRHAATYAPFDEVCFHRDQLTSIVDGLKNNRDCRRQVLQIWDHNRDLGRQTKDAACNIAATFQIGGNGRLDLVVFCRSNDIIWGCYGANAVHFSFLQEYIARSIGVSVGTYTQISVNWHAYKDVLVKTLAKKIKHELDYLNVSHCYDVFRPYPIMQTSQEVWDRDVKRFVTADGRLPMGEPARTDVHFLENELIVFEDPFFNEVATPIVMAHDFHKNGDTKGAIDVAMTCKADDWRIACVDWLERRIADKEGGK